ncbi:hypothetical protein [Rhizorhabdus argentea]|uniref:hypothetical protein n=1 Tax=Rhizorhabdus argentea TaxID=1387174 RepID=UPI003BF49CBF
MDNSRNELLCANSIWVFVPMLCVGVFLMAGFLPPPSPSMGPHEVAKIFSPDNVMMRAGIMLAMLGSCTFLLPMLAIGAQLRRMEGPNPILSNANDSVAALCCVCNMVPCFLWLAASYRSNISPDVITVMNDLAWFIFIGGIATQILLNLVQGICILNDRSGLDIYPRWLGYWNILLVLTFLPDVLLPFFRTGPFTYSGVLGFWVPAFGYFTWMSLNYWFTVRAIRRQSESARLSTTARLAA